MTILITGNPPPQKKSKKNKGHFARIVFCQQKSLLNWSMLKPPDKIKSSLGSPKKKQQTRFFSINSTTLKLTLVFSEVFCPYVTCFRSHPWRARMLGNGRKIVLHHFCNGVSQGNKSCGNSILKPLKFNIPVTISYPPTNHSSTKNIQFNTCPISFSIPTSASYQPMIQWQGP